MRLIIKTRGSNPINDRDKKFAEKKFQKLSKLMPADSVVEITLEQLNRIRDNGDKHLQMVAELPYNKEPFHLEETQADFRSAIETARDRFERHLKKNHEKWIDSKRVPRESLMNRIFGRFRKKGEDKID